MTEIDELYQGRILELAANSQAHERLAQPHATAEAYSKLCGSRITADLCMEGEVITAYGHDVKACLLGQTAAAVVAANIVGSTAGEFRAVARQMRQMLKENGEPPSGKWADLALLESVRGYRARHGSTLLVFDAVEDALNQIDQRRRMG
ncbi:MAG: iron-sulfur cluster assembly scaffold protein [Alphaproteobacteria bacterium]